MKLIILKATDEEMMLERIEIPVPEGATIANIAFYSESHIFNKIIIPLSRPKVKKWIWERKHITCEGLLIRTEKPMTEEDVGELYPFYYGWRKVEGSEVEVEE